MSLKVLKMRDIAGYLQSLLLQLRDIVEYLQIALFDLMLQFRILFQFAVYSGVLLTEQYRLIELTDEGIHPLTRPLWQPLLKNGGAAFTENIF